jgi:hypothetical protein
MALVAAGVGIAIVPEGVARGNPDVAVSKAAGQVSTGPSGRGEREEIVRASASLLQRKVALVNPSNHVLCILRRLFA